MSLDQKTIELLVKCDCFSSLYRVFIDTKTSRADLLKLPIHQVKQKLRAILPLGVDKREEIIAKIVLELTKDDEEDVIKRKSSCAGFQKELDQLLVMVKEGILNKCDETLENHLMPENFAKLVEKFIALIPPEDREERIKKLDKVVFESAVAVEDPSFYWEYSKIVHSPRIQEESELFITEIDSQSLAPQPRPSQSAPPQRQIKDSNTTEPTSSTVKNSIKQRFPVDNSKAAAVNTNASEGGGDTVQWTPRFSLSTLTKPNRIGNTIAHRSEINAVMKSLISQNGGMMTASRTSGQATNAYDNVNPGGGTIFPSFFRGLPSLHIRDMDPYECRYNMGKITLEIIEDVQSFIRVMLLAQDKLGDVVYVALYNDYPSRQDPLLDEKIGYGCTITIANPLMKIALDGRTMIRVEEDEDLFIHRKKDVKMCRFCTKPNADRRCARCKTANYCSKECQSKDWEVMKHKLVCDAYKWINDHTVG